MEKTIFMNAALRCPKDTFPTYFGQWHWNILYGSTVGFLICIMGYKLLGKD